MINDLGTGLPKKRLEGWDFVELVSQVDAPDEMADLWEELGQDRTKLAANLGELKEEIASRESSDAIYWNHFELAHVRVCQIQLSSTSVFARLHFIPFPGEVKFGPPNPSSQPFAHPGDDRGVATRYCGRRIIEESSFPVMSLTR